MLSRAFTTRRKKAEMQITAPMFISRAASQRGGRPVVRAQISSPVTLLSTSNVLLNNAQGIIGTAHIEMQNDSSGSSIGSSGDSDAGTGSIHSNETVTDASSVDESPMKAEPETNHLSCYFKPSVDTQSKSPSLSPSSSVRQSLDTPMLPKRVPSHSKKAHEHIHRKNSVRRMLSPASTAREAIRDSAIAPYSPTQLSFAAFVEAPKENPFGSELAQLQEVAEEFGQVVRDVEAEADLKVIDSWGLAQLAASDYMSEIQSMIYDTFTDEPANSLNAWI